MLLILTASPEINILRRKLQSRRLEIIDNRILDLFPPIDILKAPIFFRIDAVPQHIYLRYFGLLFDRRKKSVYPVKVNATMCKSVLAWYGPSSKSQLLAQFFSGGACFFAMICCEPDV